MIGKTIQGYEILEALDAGAMGVVYKAKDPNLPRVVAIKVMKRALVDEEVFLERFRVEAASLAMIQSPHIVTIHRLIDSDEQLAIVMEFVAGRSLQQLCDDEKPSWPRIAGLIRQVLAGLGKAHAAGIVHRDIKPSNVLVRDDEMVKIVDFGLAKSEQLGRNLTQTGTSAGTLYYMSPEQIHGFRDVGPRSDLYSVGMTFYRILCGRLPFETSGSNFEILKEIVEGEFLSADRIQPSLPASLVRFLDKSIQKRAEDRFSSAEEMIAELDRILREESSPSSDSVSPSRPPAPTETFVLGSETAASQPSEPSSGIPGGPTALAAGTVEPASGLGERADSMPRSTERIGPSGQRPSLIRRLAFAVTAVAVVAAAIWLTRSRLWDFAENSAVPQDPTSAAESAAESNSESVAESAAASNSESVVESANDADTASAARSGAGTAAGSDAETEADSDPRRTDATISGASADSLMVTQLEPTTAIAITVRPWGRVSLDGAEVGERVSSEIFPVAAGPVRVRVRHPEYGTWQKRIQAADGESTAVRVDFTRQIPVVVTSQGEDGRYVMGEIFVDGRSTGSSTPKEIQLRVGTHSIEVRQIGYTCEPVRFDLFGPLENPIKVTLRKD